MQAAQPAVNHSKALCSVAAVCRPSRLGFAGSSVCAWRLAGGSWSKTFCGGSAQKRALWVWDVEMVQASLAKG